MSIPDRLLWLNETLTNEKSKPCPDIILVDWLTKEIGIESLIKTSRELHQAVIQLFDS